MDFSGVLRKNYVSDLLILQKFADKFPYKVYDEFSEEIFLSLPEKFPKELSEELPE